MLNELQGFNLVNKLCFWAWSWLARQKHVGGVRSFDVSVSSRLVRPSHANLLAPVHWLPYCLTRIIMSHTFTPAPSSHQDVSGSGLSNEWDYCDILTESTDCLLAVSPADMWLFLLWRVKCSAPNLSLLQGRVLHSDWLTSIIQWVRNTSFKIWVMMLCRVTSVLPLKQKGFTYWSVLRTSLL